MLDELSLTLPRLKSYEKTVPMGPDLESSLLEIYTEVICFYARTIHFFKSHKHGNSTDCTFLYIRMLMLEQ